MRRPARRFYLELAATLGFASADALLGEVDAFDLAEWQAFAQVAWLPHQRLEFLLAALCVVQTNSLKSERDKATTMADFMPWLEADDEDEDEDDGDLRRRQARMIEKVNALNAAFGGEDKREARP